MFGEPKNTLRHARNIENPGIRLQCTAVGNTGSLVVLGRYDPKKLITLSNIPVGLVQQGINRQYVLRNAFVSRRMFVHTFTFCPSKVKRPFVIVTDLSQRNLFTQTLIGKFLDLFEEFHGVLAHCVHDDVLIFVKCTFVIVFSETIHFRSFRPPD